MQKKVFFYCQHSMGIGHLIRSFALINSLKKAFGVTLVSGGDFPKGIKIPKGITFVQLPPIGIDDKNHLTAIGTNESAYEVIKIRQKKLINLFKEIQPDIFITEYFPLGKIQFMGELLPILKFIESNNLPIQVMCSSRDILEPKSIAKPLIGDFGVKIINDYYSRVLVHGDKNFIDLASRILADDAQQKQAISQPVLLPEERLYADNFPSKKDTNIMNLFHQKETWEERIKLAKMLKKNVE